MSSTDTSDSGMAKMMGLVICALTFITITAMVMANLLGGDNENPTDEIMRAALLERISPVASVRTEAQDAAAAGTEAVAVEMSPEELVQGACLACHGEAVAAAVGAPMIGDAAAWEPRNATGLDALVSSVVNGKGTMPAGGGSSYSEEDIKRAVRHLSGIE